jgi:hypothetical protein
MEDKKSLSKTGNDSKNKHNKEVEEHFFGVTYISTSQQTVVGNE